MEIINLEYIFKKKSVTLVNKIVQNIVLLLSVWVVISCNKQTEDMSMSYISESIAAPEGVAFEVTGIAIAPDQKRVAVSTRRGDIYIAKGLLEEDLSNVRWSKFAEGIHEPLGIYWEGDALVVTQRPELTRVSDKNKDGYADEFETISQDWGIDGDYHEYAFGSSPDKDGNAWVALCLTGSVHSNNKYRGWIMKIAPDGTTTPAVSGIRSPGGIGYNAQGDLFYTDNQGFWNGSSSVKPVVEGSFVGNPEGLKWYDVRDDLGEKPIAPEDPGRIENERKRIKQFVPPAVIFPHGRVANSPTFILPDLTEGKFGPFAGNTFVGEHTQASIKRVLFEKVNGVYQGAVINFRDSLEIPPLGATLSKNGYFFCGGTSHGWGTISEQTKGLVRLKWTGKMPMAIKDVKIQSNGFKVSFTESIADTITLTSNNITGEHFTYIHQSGYGSPEIDKGEIIVNEITMSEDRKTITLVLNELYKGHVHEIKMNGIVSKTGQELSNSDFWYTVNELKKGVD